MNKDERDRRDRQVIRDAMERLLDGKPTQPDGSLYVTTLAKEARVKRHLLTHRHTDLQDEFRRRVEVIGSPMPPAESALRAELDEVKKSLRRARLNLRRALAGKQRYARAVQVLEMENARAVQVLKDENAQLTERLQSVEHGPTLLPSRPG